MFTKGLFNSFFSKYFGIERFISNVEYLGLGLGTWYSAFSSEHINRTPPRQFGDVKIDLTKNLVLDIPELGVMSISSATVLGPHGWVLTQDKCLLLDFSWQSFKKHSFQVPYEYRQTKKLRGTTLSLMSDFAFLNSTHFFCDVLPRIKVFLNAGFSFHDVDHILVPRPEHGFLWDAFCRTGVPIEKCHWLEKGMQFHLEHLLVTSFPGAPRNYPAWVPRYLSEIIGFENIKRSRRLYLSRRGFKRNLTNEDEVRWILAQEGFDAFLPTECEDPLRAYAESEIIVGPHGAGFFGISLCRPGTQIIEFFSPNHVQPYYYTLADSAGLGYSYVGGELMVPNREEKFEKNHDDFSISLEGLAVALKHIL